MSACLLILIGLPGSGKTSLAVRLCASLTHSYHLVHVEYDAAVSLEEQARLQAARAAGDADGGWPAARRALEEAVEAALSGHPAPPCPLETLRPPPADRPAVYVIDDNMYLRSMRYRYFQMARRLGLGFAQALLDVPAAECLRRNGARPRPVPAAAVQAMAARLERPEAGRLWEAHSVTLPPDGDPLPAVTALLAAALRAPAAPLVDNTLEAEEARRVCSSSQLHQLDVQLRQLVRQRAAGRSERARAANAARQALLRRVRRGELGLAVEPAEADLFARTVRRLFDSELDSTAEERGSSAAAEAGADELS